MLADPSKSMIYFFPKQASNPPGSFEGGITTTASTATNAACGTVASCDGFVTGTLAGTDLINAGLIYTGGHADFFQGAIAFVKGATIPAPAPMPGPSGSGAPTGDGLRFRTYGAFPGGFDSGTVVAQASGKLDSFGTGTFAVGRGTNTDHENGGLAAVIGWNRWAGGTTTDYSVKTLSENGGGGMIWGTPVTAMPTSGTANYTLAGSTAPTVGDGSVARGTVRDAHLAVAFATMKVGFDATIGISGVDYALASPGGIATPGTALTAAGTFLTSGFTVTGGGCTPSDCGGRVSGFLAGAGASHAGFAYLFNAFKVSGINGVVALVKAP